MSIFEMITEVIDQYIFIWWSFNSFLASIQVLHARLNPNNEYHSLQLKYSQTVCVMKLSVDGIRKGIMVLPALIKIAYINIIHN